MKTDYKEGDKVVMTRTIYICRLRKEGAVFTVNRNNGEKTYGGWQLQFKEADIGAVGANYSDVRPLTKLDKVLK
jgi:hypothetical protein